MPCPEVENKCEKATKLFIFDMLEDGSRGTRANIAVLNGKIKPRDKFLIFRDSQEESQTKNSKLVRAPTPKEVGLIQKPQILKTMELNAGQIGYMYLKSNHEVNIGDTLISESHYKTAKDQKLISNTNFYKPKTGFTPPKPVVQASIFPLDPKDLNKFLKAIENLCLNDASITFDKISSTAFSKGLSIGFLGNLHYEVFLSR